VSTSFAACRAGDACTAWRNARRRLPRQLGRDHVHLLNVRRPGEQLVRLAHERLRHPAGEVSLPARVVWEDVEDGELRVAEPDREPCSCPRFLFDERGSAFEKPRDVLLLA
jgi:hypothetical protein